MSKYSEKWLAESPKRYSQRDYVLQCSVFSLRNWFNRELRVPRSGKLDISTRKMERSPYWIYFSDEGKLADLTDYERYVLFMKIFNERTITEIANTLQRNRNLVSLQIENVVDEIKLLADSVSQDQLVLG